MSGEFKGKAVLKATKVLIAEDDPIMLALLTDVLQKLGFGEIVTVADGRTAIKEVLKKDFDLILCDWLMPEIDGIEFTKTIRHLPHYEKCATPIIMVSGKAAEEDIRIARDSGVNEYLAKPFTIDMLCERVQSVVDHPRKYVLSDTYSGPDRRRRREPIPNGVERRKGNEIFTSEY